jgi:hypothetical protein
MSEAFLDRPVLRLLELFSSISAVVFRYNMPTKQGTLSMFKRVEGAFHQACRVTANIVTLLLNYRERINALSSAKLFSLGVASSKLVRVVFCTVANVS